MSMLPPFPQPLHTRFPDRLANLVGRLRLVESRTAVLDVGVLVCTRVGTIPGSYTSGQPTVQFAGQSAPTGPYPVLTGYSPAPGDTVLCVPNGLSYIVMGTFA